MKISIFPVLALFCALIFSSGEAYAGHEWGNGGDRPDFLSQTAWFTDRTRVIEICFVTTPTFGVNAQGIEAVIARAMGLWRDYIGSKRISPSVALAFQIRDTCRGSEDLTLYFGVENDTVTTAKGAHFDPVGFAQLQSYDLVRGWGKGFIWITGETRGSRPGGGSTPDWTNDDTLLGIMTHKLGHVFGVPHVEGTIMTKDIVELLLEPSQVAYFSQIDHHADLVTETFVGEVRTGIFPVLYDATLSYHELVGRGPSGKVTSILTTKHIARLSLFEPNESRYTLEIRDDVGSVTFDVHVSAATLTAAYEAANIFLATKSPASLPGEESSGLLSTSVKSQASLAFGYLVDSQNHSRTILFSRNFGRNIGQNLPARAVEVLLLNEFENRFLIFGSGLPGENGL